MVIVALLRSYTFRNKLKQPTSNKDLTFQNKDNKSKTSVLSFILYILTHTHTDPFHKFYLTTPPQVIMKGIREKAANPPGKILGYFRTPTSLFN